MDTTIKGVKLLYDEALENNNITLARAYEKYLKKVDTQENRHQSIIKGFKNNQIQSAFSNGKTFKSLKEYLAYHEKDI